MSEGTLGGDIVQGGKDVAKFIIPFHAPTAAVEAVRGGVKVFESLTERPKAPAGFPEVSQEVPAFPIIEFPAFPEPPPPPPAPTPPPPTTGEAARLVGAAGASERRRRRARFRVGRAQTILTSGTGATGGVAVKRLLGE